MSSYAALTAVTAASVPNAAAGKLNIFVDIADGLAKSKDSAGTIVILSGAQALTALSAHISDPDAHLNYVTLTEANALVAAHATLTNNPHAVTKAQVGLGNVDNTSDINKPVSTATQTALDLKVDKITPITPASYNDPKFTVNAQGQITSIRERVKGYADSNTDVNTTLTTNTTFITTNINAPVDADYYVEFAALYSHSTTNNSPLVDVLLDGVGIYSPDIVSHEEISDNTAAERILKSGFDVKNLTAGVHTLALVFRCEAGGATMTMRYGSIRYEEL